MDSEFGRFAEKVLEAARAGVVIERMRWERIIADAKAKPASKAASPSR